MTIEEYILLNPNWNIEVEYELDFVEPDNEKEAKENIKWVLKNCPDYENLAIVMRSYYGNTIDW